MTREVPTDPSGFRHQSVLRPERGRLANLTLHAMLRVSTAQWRRPVLGDDEGRLLYSGALAEHVQLTSRERNQLI